MNEIEDVVSSVRRLVSPEARPRPLSRDLGLEKLILTPALRVVPEAAKAKKPTAKPKAAAAPRRGRKAETPKPDPIRVEPAAPVVEAEWEAPFWTEPEPALAEMALQAEEAVVVTSPEPVAEVAPAPPVTKPAAARKKPAPKTPASKPALQAVKAAPKARKAAAKPVPVAAKPVLELVRSEPDGAEVAPDMDPPNAVAAEPVADPLAIEADAQIMIEVAVAAGSAAPTALEEELVVNGVAQVLTDRDGNPVSLLDEDELIQMVRRVIREELQDVLGERITRNIRKLVRAEINRALTSQTLE